MTVPSAPDIEYIALSAEQFKDLLGLPTDPDEVLREVLSREEFQESSVQSFIDRLRESLSTFLNDFFSRIGDYLPRPGSVDGDYGAFWGFLHVFLYMVIFCLFIFGLLLFLFYVLDPIIRRRFPHTSAVRDAQQEDEESAEPSQEEVTELIRQGDFRTALIRLFRVVLIQLDSKGRVMLHQARTTREILNAFPPQEPTRETFKEMIVIFNKVRYGAASCDKVEFEYFETLTERLVGR